MLRIVMFAALLGMTFAAAADAAVIVTTSGEKIVCEIVREEPTYYVVNHGGYERRVLKSRIRSIDLAATGEVPERRQRTSFDVIGGYTVSGNNSQSGLGSLSVGLLRSLHEYILIRLAFDAANTSFDENHKRFEMFGGSYDWRAATASIVWEFPIAAGIGGFAESGVGYFYLSHEVSDTELEYVRSALSDPDQLIRYTEPLSNSVGAVVRLGLSAPLTNRLRAVVGGSAILIPTSYDERWYFVGISEPISNGSKIFMRTFQAYLGLRLTL